MSGKFKIDGDAIRQLAEILVDTKLTEIEYEDEGRRIRISQGVSGGTIVPMQTATVVATDSAAPVGPAATAPTPAAATTHPGAVKSPMVGTAYMSAEPGAAPYVKVGDSVSAGQTLMIIEAMKVMNPIKAPQAGKITQILAKDAHPVEFGEPLMVIE